MGEPAISRYALCALAAAALFGASTPIAKALVADIHPVVLAALLYLGSGGAPLTQPQQRTP